MEYHHGDKHDVAEELSFSSLSDNSYHSQHPEDFYQSIFDEDYPAKTKAIRKKSHLLSASKLVPPAAQAPEPMEEEMEEEKEEVGSNLKVFLKKVVSDRPVRSDRYSEPEESEWNHEEEAV